jgi:hypothetical protein
MMVSAEAIGKDYDGFVANLRSKFPNVEPFLLIKSMMLARKYPHEYNQSFYIDLYVRQGADPDRKRAEIFARTGIFAANHGHNHLSLSLNTTLDTILELASDPDIANIEGEVFPFS